MFSKLCLLLVASVGASCTHNLRVIDEAGNPVEDAQVRRMTRSFNHPPTSTNAKGTARIRKDLPTIEALHISKIGYITPTPVNFDLPKPITVVLKKR